MKTLYWIWVGIAVICFVIPIVLVFTALPALQEHARDVSRQNNLQNIAADLNMYHAQHGTYPAVDQYTSSKIGVSSTYGDDKIGTVYESTPVGCNATSVPCTGFNLSYTDPFSYKKYALSN